MNLIKTRIPDCYIIQVDKIDDKRGTFVKTYNKASFSDLGLCTSFNEEYYSVSKKNVLRGLHFQIPPNDHVKVVYCLAGRVFDAVVDLRKDSPTYGRYEAFELSADEANMLYIPTGLAHGFYVLSEWATVAYKVSTIYSPEHDTGILWNSVDIPWPDKNPVISERDSRFLNLKEFKSPFDSGG